MISGAQCVKLPWRRSVTFILLDKPVPLTWNGATLGEAQARAGCLGGDPHMQAQVSSVIRGDPQGTSSPLKPPDALGSAKYPVR